MGIIAPVNLFYKGDFASFDAADYFWYSIHMLQILDYAGCIQFVDNLSLIDWVFSNSQSP